jgi:hypothetical protein
MQLYYKMLPQYTSAQLLVQKSVFPILHSRDSMQSCVNTSQHQEKLLLWTKGFSHPIFACAFAIYKLIALPLVVSATVA